MSILVLLSSYPALAPFPSFDPANTIVQNGVIYTNQLQISESQEWRFQGNKEEIVVLRVQSTLPTSQLLVTLISPSGASLFESDADEGVDLVVSPPLRLQVDGEYRITVSSQKPETINYYLEVTNALELVNIDELKCGNTYIWQYYPGVETVLIPLQVPGGDWIRLEAENITPLFLPSIHVIDDKGNKLPVIGVPSLISQQGIWRYHRDVYIADGAEQYFAMSMPDSIRRYGEYTLGLNCDPEDPGIFLALDPEDINSPENVREIVAYSKDMILVAGFAGILLFEINGSEAGDIDVEQIFDRPVSTMKLSPDKRYLLISERAGNLIVLDMVTRSIVDQLNQYNWFGPQIVFSSLSDDVVASYGDGIVRVWNTSGWQQQYAWREHMHHITDVVFGPDEHHLVSAGNEGSIFIYDLRHPEEVEIITHHTRTVNFVTFDRDHEYLISGGEDGILNVYSTETWDLEYSYILNNALRNTQHLPESNEVLISVNESIFVYDLAQPAMTPTLLADFDYEIEEIESNMSGSYILVRLKSQDSSIFIVDTKTGIINSWDYDYPIVLVSFIADDIIALATQNNELIQVKIPEFETRIMASEIIPVVN